MDVGNKFWAIKKKKVGLCSKINGKSSEGSKLFGELPDGVTGEARNESKFWQKPGAEEGHCYRDGDQWMRKRWVWR